MVDFGRCCFFSHSAYCCQPENFGLHGGQSHPWSAEHTTGKREQNKKSGSAPPPPPHAARSEKIKYKSRDASTCLGAATQVSVRLALVQDSFDSSTEPMCRFPKSYASVCDNNFLSLVPSLFSWRYLDASTSSFLHAAMNLRPPYVAVSTHISSSHRYILSPSHPVLSALHPQGFRTRFALAAARCSFE